MLASIQAWGKLGLAACRLRPHDHESCFGDYPDKYAELYRWLERSKPVPGSLLEFGVAAGGTTCIIGWWLQSHKIAKSLHSFDAFKGFDVEEYSYNVQQGYVSDMSNVYEFGDASCGYRYVQAKLMVYGLREQVTLHRGWFTKSVPKFLDEHQDGNGTFSFVLIDCDLATSATTVLRRIAPQIAPGAVVVTDDYGSLAMGKSETVFSPGIKQFVAQAIKEYDIQEHGYTNGLYHLIWPEH